MFENKYAKMQEMSYVVVDNIMCVTVLCVLFCEVYILTIKL